MCTVTFIPESVSGFILTSNRDEAPNRSTVPPKIYEVKNVFQLNQLETLSDEIEKAIKKLLSCYDGLIKEN